MSPALTTKPASLPVDDATIAATPAIETKSLIETASDRQRRSELGVYLDKYKWVSNRKVAPSVVSKVNRDIQWPIIKSFGTQLIGKVASPIMLTHIVTTRCNYSCHFCSFADSLNAKSDELSLEEIDKVYASIGNNLNVIVYSGGETTLHKNLPEIIESAYRQTPVKSVYIISNAWKPDKLFDITHQIKQRCPDLHLTWSLSIEGPKQINNETRYTKANDWDAWQNTIDTVEGLKAMRTTFGYSQLDVQMCTVCSPSNVAVMDDWYEQIRDVIQPDKWNLNLMRKSVQMSDNDMASFDERRAAKQLEPFEKKYLEITERVRKDVINGKLQFLYHTDTPMDGAMKSAVDLISQEENRRTLNEEPLKFRCKAGSFGAYISSTGEVSGCEEFAHSPKDPKVFGLLREHDYNFDAIWQGEKATAFRKKVNQSVECHGCTLESQRNYPAILLDPKTLLEARGLAQTILT